MKILALDVGGTAIKSALILNSKIITYYESPSQAKLGAQYLIKNMYGVIDRYNDDYDVIGISTSGQVNSETGTIIYANDNIPNYTGTNLKELISMKYKKKVHIENDVNAAALGECYYGVGVKHKDFLCLTYGTGIGGAIIINNSIYKGATGSAGEFGHIITHPQGDICNCGQQGCYEIYASTSTLIKNCSCDYSHLINGRLIFAEFHQGNKNIIQVVDNWIDEIIIGLTSIIHIFNPSLIILGGGIMDQTYIIDEINRKIQGKVMTTFQQVSISKALLGNKAGIYGMVAMIENTYG